MQREELVPSPPEGIAARDRENFIRHFRDRQKVELDRYGSASAREVFGSRGLFVSPQQLNTTDVARAVKRFDPDLAFIFGSDLIRSPLIDRLPKWRINLHLGLSPWYKGAATLFWPFYFLSPQMAGVTFHQIVAAADAGGVVHQSVPKLTKGDGVHDVAANAVLQAKRDLTRLLDDYDKTREFVLHEQRTPGRLFLGADFQPAHLRVLYDLYDNRIVDETWPAISAAALRS